MKRKFNRLASYLLIQCLVGVPALFAMGRPQDPNAPAPPAWVSLMPMLVMIGIFYVLMIRPQMKQKNERQKMMDSLKKGDKIITQGGIIATIVNISPTVIEVKLNEETKVKILRTAVSDLYTETGSVDVVSTPAQ